ncbi:hypothetical protein CKN86_12840 [Carnobacterium divergens]|uniref:DUF4097 domain-containing protein n=3 Tax=Carnobacterium TaxID=2747 RepID=A0A5F0MD39_CARDV|nr:DUF1700 domain-containing protein [Carnobacterium divergens]TFI61283.1 hypothetical protein CKN62_12980 [Carnobacterium divergens]TFI70292.1 hypothetical protein CKN58_12795 [Carnobacterium divergens]TFI70964.1 hypothetical protein CKN81_12470 [Carnobacterium divergens]TFI75286.1 hypothetical protein CKN85_12850 [Carnobacterium divergens]
MKTMDLTKEYFKELKSYFSEDDLESYYEIKEDLLDHIEACKEDGQTIEEALSSLASPKEIADDFFEDRRLQTAMYAEKDVIPSEEIQSVFLDNQKKKMKILALSILTGVRIFFMSLLLLLLFYFLVYLGEEVINEKHLAIIPFSSSLMIVAIIILGLRKKTLFKKLYLNGWTSFLLGSLSLIMVAGGYLAGDLFYQGIKIEQDLVIKNEKDVKLIMDSDADVEITTVEVPKNEEFRIFLSGRFKKSELTKINHAVKGNKFDLEVDKRNKFDFFTRTGSSEMVVFIPAGTKLDSLDFNLTKGELRIIDLHVDRFNLNLVDGDLYGKNITSNSGEIHSEFGEVVIEDSKTNLKVDSQKGKTILTMITGDVEANIEDGLSIFKDLTAKKVNVKSNSGKFILEDSTIQKLIAVSNDGQSIVKRTKGSVDLKTTTGKMILRSNNGPLKVSNDEGTVISIQHDNLNADIKSKSGFIKWIQDGDADIRIVAVSKTGDVTNEFNSKKKAPYKVKLKSDTGMIRVIKKVN